MADSAGAAPPKPSTSVKLVLLGEAAVGKSSLVLRFVNNDFQENKEPTIGAAFLTQKSHLPHRTIKFEIWDTAGQERFASLAPMYYRNAQSALVVYDLTKPTSLVKAKHWVAELQRQASPGIVIALVGNKLDLTNESSEAADTPSTTNTEGAAEGEENADAAEENGDARKISTKEGREYAEEEGLLFFETSAKSGVNVQEVFTAIANAIPETQMKTSKTQAVGGGTQTALGAERVNLNKRAEGAKEGCAC
ncbi:hypothetical protein OEA41_001459 [Lepraria neglecta]|uniref:Uncharacterized protein n=1 Tax=Lepraria neglecta TaxID=209136 RepID=A0AAD9ZA50_9LECA|nr:hypothetical protein OEA41_001459 [Lepraria neglecta]